MPPTTTDKPKKKRASLPLSPLLQADPATLPPFRKGKGNEGRIDAFTRPGGLLDYIREVMPGPPPLGWRDITPYFGGVPNSIGPYRELLKRYGFHIAVQTVKQDGQRYRRVAVVLLPRNLTPNQGTNS